MPISSTPNARRHGIIMLLLSITLIFTVISVALIINVLNKKADPQELANVCGIAMNEMLSRATCPNTEPSTQTTPKHIDAASNMIGFDYPADFSIMFSQQGGEGDAPHAWAYAMSSGILSADMISGYPITITVDNKTVDMGSSAEEFATYLNERYKNGYLEGLTITKNANGTFTVIGSTEGGFGSPIPFEDIFYPSEKFYGMARINFSPEDTSRAAPNAKGWELIKASLDFSKIE